MIHKYFLSIELHITINLSCFVFFYLLFNKVCNSLICTVCQKKSLHRRKNVKCVFHSRIPTIKSLHYFFNFCTHSITELVYDHNAPIVF